MDETSESSADHKMLSIFDLIIMVLSVYVLVALLVDSFFPLSPEVSRLLGFIDKFYLPGLHCRFFIRNLVTAPSMTGYLKWG